MTKLHESYKPGNLMSMTLSDGGAIVLGSVIEGEAKPMGYLYSVQMPDGAFVAFDQREVQQLANAFENTSRLPKARLEALAMAINAQFPGPDAFYTALVGVAQKMAARPAAHLH